MHHEGELLGYVANLAHHVDVGGGAPASIGAFREVFQEGVIIPPVKLVAGGRIVDDVFRLILAQIRSKHETAATSARRSRRTQRACAASRRSSTGTGSRRSRATMARAARRTPSAARAPSSRRCRTASTRPRASVDNDGYTDEPVRLQARASSSRPTRVRFDMTGSDPQRRAPVNSTYAMTFSACAYALKCLIDPDLPVNDGFYRLLDVHAPPGTVVELHLAGAGRRRLGDADAPRRGALPRAAARVPGPAAGGDEGDDVPGGLRRARRRGGRVHLLLRHVRRRLRRPARERRPGRGADARPEHRERADRGDRAQLPGADRAARARRGLRGAGPAPRRARPAQGLPLRPARRRSRSSPTATASARGASFGGHDARRRRVRPVRDGVETRLGSKVDASSSSRAT